MTIDRDLEGEFQGRREKLRRLQFRGCCETILSCPTKASPFSKGGLRGISAIYLAVGAKHLGSSVIAVVLPIDVKI